MTFIWFMKNIWQSNRKFDFKVWLVAIKDVARVKDYNFIVYYEVLCIN